MRAFLLLCLLGALPALNVEAACARRADPNKVILYLNVNGSFNELDGATAAACARGETLVVLPPPASPAIRREIASASGHLRDLEDVKLVCQGRIPPDPSHKIPKATCDQASSNFDAASSKYQTLLTSKNVQPFSDSAVQAKINELAQRGAAITTLVISGHDGGSTFSDDSEHSISVYSLFSYLKTAYASRPDLLEKLHSVLLWGCYTATPEKIMTWEQNLPSLKLIAGFAAIAPASMRATSRELMKSTLLAEDRAVHAHGMREFEGIVNRFNDLNDGTFGVYAKQCNGDAYYFTNEPRDPSDVRKGLKHQFETWQQVIDCQKFPGQISAQRTLLNQYLSGEKPIPADTSGGELRGLYGFARTHSNCIPKSDQLNDDHVGFLLFFNSLKLNFAADTAGDVVKLDPAIAGLDAGIPKIVADQRTDVQRSVKYYQDEIDAIRNGKYSSTNLTEEAKTNLIASYQKSMGEEQAKLNDIDSGASARDLQIKLANFRAAYWSPTLDNIQNKSRGDILKEANLLEGLCNTFPSEELFRYSNLLQQYLVDLNPTCMDFLDWHEFHPNGPRPAMKCNN